MRQDSEGHWREGTLSPADVKRQHYVPVTYLNPFASSDSRIWVVDQDSEQDYRTSLLNAALETHFNDLEVDGVILSTETWLSEIEGKATPILSKLINDPDSISSLTAVEENDFGRFVTALKFRVPAAGLSESETYRRGFVTGDSLRIIKILRPPASLTRSKYGGRDEQA